MKVLYGPNRLEGQSKIKNKRPNRLKVMEFISQSNVFRESIVVHESVNKTLYEKNT